MAKLTILSDGLGSVTELENVKRIASGLYDIDDTKLGQILVGATDIYWDFRTAIKQCPADTCLGSVVVPEFFTRIDKDKVYFICPKSFLPQIASLRINYDNGSNLIMYKITSEETKIGDRVRYPASIVVTDKAGCLYKYKTFSAEYIQNVSLNDIEITCLSNGCFNFEWRSLSTASLSFLLIIGDQSFTVHQGLITLCVPPGTPYKMYTATSGTVSGTFPPCNAYQEKN